MTATNEELEARVTTLESIVQVLQDKIGGQVQPDRSNSWRTEPTEKSPPRG